jgi:hypothetical protein
VGVRSSPARAAATQAKQGILQFYVGRQCQLRKDQDKENEPVARDPRHGSGALTGGEMIGALWNVFFPHVIGDARAEYHRLRTTFRTFEARLDQSLAASPRLLAILRELAESTPQSIKLICTIYARRRVAEVFVYLTRIVQTLPYISNKLINLTCRVWRFIPKRQ